MRRSTCLHSHTFNGIRRHLRQHPFIERRKSTRILSGKHKRQILILRLRIYETKTEKEIMTERFRLTLATKRVSVFSREIRSIRQEFYCTLLPVVKVVSKVVGDLFYNQSLTKSDGRKHNVLMRIKPHAVRILKHFELRNARFFNRKGVENAINQHASISLISEIIGYDTQKLLF